MGVLGSVLVVALFVLVAWAVAGTLGFRFDLGFSLIGSVVLTLLLNLVLRAFRSSR